MIDLAQQCFKISELFFVILVSHTKRLCKKIYKIHRRVLIHWRPKAFNWEKLLLLSLNVCQNSAWTMGFVTRALSLLGLPKKNILRPRPKWKILCDIWKLKFLLRGSTGGTIRTIILAVTVHKSDEMIFSYFPVNILMKL